MMKKKKKKKTHHAYNNKKKNTNTYNGMNTYLFSTAIISNVTKKFSFAYGFVFVLCIYV